MITPEELFVKNQRKLEHLVSTLEAIQLKFDNTQPINVLLNKLMTVEGQDKADISYKLGQLYSEMSDQSSALMHFKNAADFSDSPTATISS